MAKTHQLLAYQVISDEKLAILAQNGDVTAIDELLNRYRGYIRNKCNSFFLQNAEPVDKYAILVWEFIDIIKCFNPKRSTSFRSFVKGCLDRKTVSVIRSAARIKDRLMIPISRAPKHSSDENDEGDPINDLPDIHTPETTFLAKEIEGLLSTTINKILSPFERRVFLSHLDDKSYKEIAQEEECTVKSVDNALHRARHKIREVFKRKGLL